MGNEPSPAPMCKRDEMENSTDELKATWIEVRNINFVIKITNRDESWYKGDWGGRLGEFTNYVMVILPPTLHPFNKWVESARKTTSSSLLQTLNMGGSE
ncbi:hypothetical protein C1H46_031168 [Malus baccata]|uniref:Uncharacterized protein n=1 Tax=Malus baccata TaxID=106549 RepID=A0A540L9W3_MALBA|nr:hypothetical protein C1H46_031168 [Malus baccata]